MVDRKILKNCQMAEEKLIAHNFDLSTFLNQTFTSFNSLPCHLGKYRSSPLSTTVVNPLWAVEILDHLGPSRRGQKNKEEDTESPWYKDTITLPTPLGQAGTCNICGWVYHKHNCVKFSITKNILSFGDDRRCRSSSSLVLWPDIFVCHYWRWYLVRMVILQGTAAE